MIKSIIDRLLFGRQEVKFWLDTHNPFVCIARSGFSPQTVIDVGTGFGSPELYFNFPAARHILIEPLAEWEETLKAISRQHNAEYILAAAADAASKAKMCVLPGLADSFLCDDKAKGACAQTAEMREVALVSLDELCLSKGCEGPYLVKVDARGSELRVLKGARQILEQAPVVCVRFRFREDPKLDPAFKGICAFMRERGYRRHSIENRLYHRQDNRILEADAMFIKEDRLLRASSFSKNRGRDYADTPAVVANPALITGDSYKFIAERGFMGSTGGIFNPGVVGDQDGFWVLARGEKYTWPKARFPIWRYIASYRPLLLRLDKQMRIENAVPAAMRGFPGAKFRRFGDDSRLFCFRGNIYVNHYSIWFMPDLRVRLKKVRSSLSRLDTENGSLHYLGEVSTDFRLKDIEKNSTYFEHNGQLYLLYSVYPYRLLKAREGSLLDFTTAVQSDVSFPIDSGHLIGLSSNPVDYDGDHYLVMIKKRNDRFYGSYSYGNWALLIDKKTLLPSMISSRPLLRGPAYRGQSRLMYLMSAVNCGDELYFFFGESDLNLCCAMISRDRLNRHLVRL